MTETGPVLSTPSKIFFVVFFGLIAASIANAYYHVEILKDYNVYTEEDEIPRAADFYLEFLP